MYTQNSLTTFDKKYLGYLKS